MAVSASRAAEVLARCARRCCICRRFRPLHLQVHHIVEQSEGGTDEVENLIAICVSCHCDVHTETTLTRRFTVKELKLHRDNVCQLVADGNLAGGNDSDDALALLSASIVQRLLAVACPPPITHPQLRAEAVQVLLAAVRGNTPINIVNMGGNVVVLAGGEQFGDQEDYRISAKYRDAINQLFGHGLTDGRSEFMTVTESGFILADDILAAGADTK